MTRFSAIWPSRLLVIIVALSIELVSSQPNIDGGRGDLPGMKKDMFDEVNKAKKAGGQRMAKGPPDCPKSDKMTPFFNLAWVGTEMFARLDSAEGECHKVEAIGGANLSVLKNASLTCGPAGEWKKRVAEELSAVFFQAGLDWVKNDNDTIEVMLEGNLTFEVAVSEAKYAEMMDCWRGSCGCEQAKNPRMKLILFACLIIALGGLSYDSLKLGWESFRGTKPPKHVLSKKGHRMQEVNFCYSHLCDICKKAGTTYQCTLSNYDMCKSCYKAAKKKVKENLKKWAEAHPEDEDSKKILKEKSKDDDDKDDDDDKKNEDSQSEAGDKKDSQKESEAESGDAATSEADKDGTTPPTTGDEKAE
jgi:hypothetical protein